MKDIVVDSETVCLWLVDHSYDRAKNTLCCLELKRDFNDVFLFISQENYGNLWEFIKWRHSLKEKTIVNFVTKLRFACPKNNHGCHNGSIAHQIFQTIYKVKINWNFFCKGMIGWKKNKSEKLVHVWIGQITLKPIQKAKDLWTFWTRKAG